MWQCNPYNNAVLLTGVFSLCPGWAKGGWPGESFCPFSLKPYKRHYSWLASLPDRWMCILIHCRMNVHLTLLIVIRFWKHTDPGMNMVWAQLLFSFVVSAWAAMMERAEDACAPAHRELLFPFYLFHSSGALGSFCRKNIQLIPVLFWQRLVN